LSVWRLAAAVLLAGLWASPATAQSGPPPTIDAFGQVYSDWMQRHRIHRATLAVSRQGRLVFAQGYGDAGPDTALHVGSLSKAVTAVCVATLVQDGRLDWNTKLGDVLKDFFARSAPRDTRVRSITVEHLITHRAGFGTGAVPDPLIPAMGTLWRSRRAASLGMAEVLREALQVDLGSDPGAVYRYANLGYHALGFIVETLTGEPYGSYCQRVVLAPLGARISRVSPYWQPLGAVGGWAFTGPEYLAFLRIFEPRSATLLTPATKQWLFDGDNKWIDDSKTVLYSLGVAVRPLANGGFNLWHGGALTYAQSDTADGPRHASFGAFAARLALGVSWFAAYEPRPPAGARAELDHEMGRAAESIKEWPDTDLFPALGLR
jgi:CubicO group peptidase (beta-lactamase class C family)